MAEQVQEQTAPEVTVRTEGGATGEDPRRFTQEDVNKFTANTRRETEKAAKEAKEKEISESLGVSIDEAKTLIEERIKQQEANQSAEQKAEKLDADLKAEKGATKAEKERGDRYEVALKGYLEKEREGIPEHLTALLDRMDVVEQLAYISEHRDTLKPQEEPAIRRAPDASATSRDSSGSVNSFNDLLRQRGLAPQQ